MLSFNGNTAPYLLYAYTRIRSIFRKLDDAGEQADLEVAPDQVSLQGPELVLAKKLLNFGLVIDSVITDFRPNYLCNYLYELSGDFTTFYESCPVLKADGADRPKRLVLCHLTAIVLKQGLELLGIETTEQM